MSASSASFLAASTNVGSLSSTNAALGVLERIRAAVQSSRAGASNASSCGCRNARCQCIYNPRRHWLLPVSEVYSRLGKLRCW